MHLCRGVISWCNDYQMSVRDRFYSKNRDLSTSDHVCGSESCHLRSKEITEDLGKIIDRGGKSTKIFYSSKSTITLLKFYLSTSKSTSLKIYSSKSKK